MRSSFDPAREKLKKYKQIKKTNKIPASLTQRKKNGERYVRIKREKEKEGTLVVSERPTRTLRDEE